MSRGTFSRNATNTSWDKKGRYSGQEPSTPPITPGSRNIRKQPFRSDDIWNLPLANGAVFASANDPRCVALRTPPVTYYPSFGINGPEDYSHPIYYATTSDPLVTITDRTNAGRTRTNVRLPANAIPSPGRDQHLHIQQPPDENGNIYMIEMFSFRRSDLSAHRIERVDLKGYSTGPGNGTRAYGGPARGGLIMLHECDPTHPDYTDGKIRHALAFAAWPQQMWINWELYKQLYGTGYNGYFYHTSGTVTVENQKQFEGWPVGHPLAKQNSPTLEGFHGIPGFVAPASEMDWDAGVPSSPEGSDFHQWYSKRGATPDGIQMGSLWAIPPSTDINSLGLQTPLGLEMAWTLQNWGGYCTDTAGLTAFFTEISPLRSGPDVGGYGKLGASVPAVSALEANSGAEIQKLFNAMRVVTNSTYQTPGGAARSSTDRRQPLLPELSL